jgi:hypothetical protein
MAGKLPSQEDGGKKSFFIFILRQTFRIGKTTATFEVSFLITSHFKHKKARREVA